MTTTTQRPRRPVLIYRGGKYRIAPWIVGFFPPHEIYCEPFGGAASVLMAKRPSKIEYYNDLDDEVVNVFKILRTQPSRLAKLLRNTPYSRTEYMRAYTPGGSDLERARKTIVKAFFAKAAKGLSVSKASGFNSMKTGRSYAREWLSYENTISAFASRLMHVTIENRDAFELMSCIDSPNTLHYVDPPYAGSTRGANQYRHDMLENSDHQRLAETLHSLTGHVIVSGYRCDLYDRLYKGWKRHDKPSRNAASNPRIESIWIKPTR